MQTVWSSIALACLLAGADAFGAMPEPENEPGPAGPSHPCIMPGSEADAADAGFSFTGDGNTFCGRSEDAAQCEDYPAGIVGPFFG